jgi:hypothetical protein
LYLVLKRDKTDAHTEQPRELVETRLTADLFVWANTIGMLKRFPSPRLLLNRAVSAPGALCNSFMR